MLSAVNTAGLEHVRGGKLRNSDSLFKKELFTKTVVLAYRVLTFTLDGYRFVVWPTSRVDFGAFLRRQALVAHQQNYAISLLHANSLCALRTHGHREFFR